MFVFLTRCTHSHLYTHTRTQIKSNVRTMQGKQRKYVAEVKSEKRARSPISVVWIQQQLMHTSGSAHFHLNG